MHPVIDLIDSCWRSLRRCCRKNKTSHVWYTAVDCFDGAAALQVHCSRLQNRQFSFCSFSPARNSAVALWSCRIFQRCAVFTHGPVFPLCICPVMVLPFRLGHMIYCPLRAHYLTSVLQQQRDHPQSIKRNSTQAGMYTGSFAPTICSGKKTKTGKITINVAINLKKRKKIQYPADINF